jgi:hypothetical protein
MNRVTSPLPIENPCQLMIEPGEFVTFRTLAFGCWKLTCPLTTCGAVGLAQSEGAANNREMLAAASVQGFNLKPLPPTRTSPQNLSSRRQEV